MHVLLMHCAAQTDASIRTTGLWCYVMCIFWFSSNYFICANGRCAGIAGTSSQSRRCSKGAYLVARLAWLAFREDALPVFMLHVFKDIKTKPLIFFLTYLAYVERITSICAKRLLENTVSYLIIKKDIRHVLLK